MRTTECHSAVTLANGRVVVHSPMENGAQRADMADGGCMNGDEWEEYCAVLVKENAALIKRQHENRRLAT